MRNAYKSLDKNSSNFRGKQSSAEQRVFYIDRRKNCKMLLETIQKVVIITYFMCWFSLCLQGLKYWCSKRFVVQCLLSNIDADVKGLDVPADRLSYVTFSSTYSYFRMWVVGLEQNANIFITYTVFYVSVFYLSIFLASSWLFDELTVSIRLADKSFFIFMAPEESLFQYFK